MAKRRKSLNIGPRELFLMMESLALSMDVLKGSSDYFDMPKDRLRQHNEAHDLFLELEEVWDSMSDRDREAGAGEPFNVRRAR
jgi:hypothetical protein